MTAFRLKAPAKVNLCLRVLGKRTDGFHEIESVFYQISLFDTLTFERSDQLLLTCDGKACGPIEQSLVIKAASLMRRRYGVAAGACINLDKQIPSGAGLGGGSSDAATALMGLNRLWGLNLTIEGLCALAEQVGSDVPFFLYGPAARVSGRGEIVSPFAPNSPFHLLVVKPDCSVSTGWAYHNLSKDLTLTKNRLNSKICCSSLTGGAISKVVGGLWNDFEEIVFKSFPEISEVKSRLLDAGALGAVMSGSGSSVVGLFDSREHAVLASKEFRQFWNATAETLTEPLLD